MKMRIRQIAQQAGSGRGPGRERHTQAFQAAIDFFRLDVGSGRAQGQAPESSRPAQPLQPEPGEPAPPIINPNP